jgi:hypothetical protein
VVLQGKNRNPNQIGRLPSQSDLRMSTWMVDWDSQSGTAATLVAWWNYPHDCPYDAPKQRIQNQHSQPTRSGKYKIAKDLRGSRGWARGALPFSKPLYAALWKFSIWRIQLVSGFHLGQIWATISKSLILKV